MSKSVYARLKQGTIDHHTSKCWVRTSVRHPLCPDPKNEYLLAWGQTLQVCRDFQTIYPHMRHGFLQNTLYTKGLVELRDPGNILEDCPTPVTITVRLPLQN